MTEWPPPISRNSSKSSAVRFAHEHFRRGQPELLHKITRITKSQEPTSSEMKSLKDDIFSLKKDIVSLSNRFDHRLEEMSTALEADYKQRMSNLALSYQAISAFSKQISIAQIVSREPSEQVKTDHDFSSNAEIPKEVRKVCVENTTASETPDRVQHAKILEVAVNDSPGSAARRGNETEVDSLSPKPKLMSPLMTLSGIATAMINNSSEQ